MRFDSDLASARAPYAGRHRRTPAYLRAASHLRLPHLALPHPARPHLPRPHLPRPPPPAIRKRPLPEPALADQDWPAATQPAA
jgi:hypothetical protein